MFVCREKNVDIPYMSVMCSAGTGSILVQMEYREVFIE